MMFCQLIIQSKDDNIDWRSFLTYREDGVKYEIRGYGQTYLETATDAYETYMSSDKYEQSYTVPEHD